MICLKHLKSKSNCWWIRWGLQSLLDRLITGQLRFKGATWIPVHFPPSFKGLERVSLTSAHMDVFFIRVRQYSWVLHMDLGSMFKPGRWNVCFPSLRESPKIWGFRRVMHWRWGFAGYQQPPQNYTYSKSRRLAIRKRATFKFSRHKCSSFRMLIVFYIPLWLVVSILLKNISQLGWSFPIYGNLKNVPKHQSALHGTWIHMFYNVSPRDAPGVRWDWGYPAGPHRSSNHDFLSGTRLKKSPLQSQTRHSRILNAS